MSRTKVRVAVAIIVASIATGFRYADYVRMNGRSGDIGIVWFGARSLLHGIDPYPLVGPGRPFDWDWGLYYPATSMVAILPLGFMPEFAATLLFVWVSSGLLAFALTKDDWSRVWILPSAAFIVAARSAQWSPLYCAAYLMPSLAWMLSAKPTLGLAIAAGARSFRTIQVAAVGTTLLLVSSLLLLPGWPGEWLSLVRHQDQALPAVAWPGGVFILLAALRWRVPEARLVLAMGLVPTTASWYEALPLLLVGRTKRQCQALSMISSVGFIVQGLFLNDEGFIESRETRPLLLAFCYAPSIWILLRRPNTAAEPRTA